MCPVPTAEDDVLDARSHSPPAVGRTVAHACVPTASGQMWLARRPGSGAIPRRISTRLPTENFRT
jgi:hypothetical protein